MMDDKSLIPWKDRDFSVTLLVYYLFMQQVKGIFANVCDSFVYLWGL
jgi:hypothetical protein